MTTKVIKEFGLHIEIVIDDGDRAFFVEDHISGNKTPIYETPKGWTKDDIVQHVKLMLSLAKISTGGRA